MAIQQVGAVSGNSSSPLPSVDEEAKLCARLSNITFETHGCELNRKSFNTKAGTTLYTVMRVDKKARIELLHDPIFSKYGIETQGLLIDKDATLSYWQEIGKSKQIGKTAEDFINSSGNDLNCVVQSLNYFGLQYGEALILKEKFVTLTNDPLLPIEADSIGLTKNNGWLARKIEIIESDPLNGAVAGFSMPFIVENGRPVAITHILDHPRYMENRDLNIRAVIAGINRNAELVTITVQKASYAELQKIAIAEGLVFAGLGPIEDDASLIIKTSNDLWSALSANGNTSLPMPALLKISAV